jgi:hypothetical protein
MPDYNKQLRHNLRNGKPKPTPPVYLTLAMDGDYQVDHQLYWGKTTRTFEVAIARAVRCCMDLQKRMNRMGANALENPMVFIMRKDDDIGDDPEAIVLPANTRGVTQIFIRRR